MDRIGGVEKDLQVWADEIVRNENYEPGTQAFAERVRTIYRLLVARVKLGRMEDHKVMPTRTLIA